MKPHTENWLGLSAYDLEPLEIIQTLAHRAIHCDSLLMPVAYTPAQFNDPDNAFAREIVRTGKVIYRAPRPRAAVSCRSRARTRRPAALKRRATLNARS